MVWFSFSFLIQDSTGWLFSSFHSQLIIAHLMISHLYGLRPDFPEIPPVLQIQTAPPENFLPFKNQE